jgi:protein TonB
MSTASAAALPVQGQYGAVELKSTYQRNWFRGFGISIAVHLVVLGSYYAAQIMGQEDRPAGIVRHINISELGPPPSITNASTPPPIAVSAPTAKPSIGAPVPVPDAEVSPEQTIATQEEMSQQVAPIVGDGTGDVVVQDDIVIDDGPPADFVPVEKEPQIIKQVKPEYPELAMRAALEGKVWVKIWVDKEGKPREVVVLKSDAEIFNEPAIAAAKQFLFTPAYMNNGPVSVWVSVPFNFKLADRN